MKLPSFISVLGEKNSSLKNRLRLSGVFFNRKFHSVVSQNQHWLFVVVVALLIIK